MSLQHILSSLDLIGLVGLHEVVRAETRRLIGENIEGNFHDIELGSDFLDIKKMYKR